VLAILIGLAGVALSIAVAANPEIGVQLLARFPLWILVGLAGFAIGQPLMRAAKNVWPI
jgi:hypothetical protein